MIDYLAVFVAGFASGVGLTVWLASGDVPIEKMPQTYRKHEDERYD